MEHKYIERNYEFIRVVMMNQMESSFKIGKKLIDSELDAGLLNFIVKPIVKSFYNHWINTDARKGTIEQIAVTLNTGKNLLKNGGVSEEHFNKAIEDNFQAYLKEDQTYRQCKKTHRNFKNLVENTKDCFIFQVRDSMKFLSVDAEDASSYDALCQHVYKTKEEGYNALIRQLDFNEIGIKIVEKDPSILNIITGRSIIVKSLRKGFDQTKRDLIQGLEVTFS